MPTVPNTDQRPFDIAIVGGGINGAGIARDAAGRGARVLLLERGDLASGTSSASTKLIHGGLRYLEHLAFGLVRESLVEREILWRAAPHLIQPMRFVIPGDADRRPRMLIRAGLFLYDHLGGRRDLPPARSIRLDRHPAGTALLRGPARGFEYSDCWCDDSRLVVANARDAADRGAVILTRHALTAARREGGVWRVEAGGRAFTATMIVNAAGPQLPDVGRAIDGSAPLALRRVRGSHIVLPRLFDHDLAYLLQNKDGRIVFAIPFETDFTLVGTTDVDEGPDAGPPRASEAEIDYLLTTANQHFRRRVDRGDVAWTFSGVRPLVDDEQGRPEQASRGYRLELSPAADGPPLLSVLGGKITTYRHLAERAVDLLQDRLGSLKKGAWTAGTPLPGGGFPHLGLPEEIRRLLDDHPFLGPASAERIVKAYGRDAGEWLGRAQRWEDLGIHFGAGFSEAECGWMQQREFAVTADDMLWRRSKLGLHLDADGRRRLSTHLREEAA